MDITFEIHEEYSRYVKWNVGIPRLDRSVVSSSFPVYGYQWNLRLTARMIGDYEKIETWIMTLYYTEDKSPICFPLRVYIRDKGKDLYLCQKDISNRSTDIWNSPVPHFRKKYPDIEVVGTRLLFLFDFQLILPAPETPVKVSRRVQTLDTNTLEKAEYSEELPCLKNLSLDLSKLIEEGSDTDVQLKCGDISIGTHKLILGARSEVFRTMMQSDMVEGREGIVKIIDMEPKVLYIFIKYIYTGVLPELIMDTALSLYEAADKYQVEALKKRSSHFFTKNLSPHNALRILAMADAHSDSDLKSQLLSYIIKEKIPNREVEWEEFCNQYPKLAVEVLNSFYKLSSFSK